MTTLLSNNITNFFILLSSLLNFDFIQLYLWLYASFEGGLKFFEFIFMLLFKFVDFSFVASLNLCYSFQLLQLLYLFTKIFLPFYPVICLFFQFSLKFIDLLFNYLMKLFSLFLFLFAAFPHSLKVVYFWGLKLFLLLFSFSWYFLKFKFDIFSLLIYLFQFLFQFNSFLKILFGLFFHFSNKFLLHCVDCVIMFFDKILNLFVF